MAHSNRLQPRAERVAIGGRRLSLLQREFLKLSPRSRRTLAERSGHFIHHDEPELVIEAIRQVVAEARETTL